MASQKKLNLIALALFLAPCALFFFIHDKTGIQRWVNFAYIFFCPLIATVLCLGRRRSAKFYLGIATLIVPFELTFLVAYRMSFVMPPKEMIAIYLMVFLFVCMIALPLGVALTYMGTRE